MSPSQTLDTFETKLLAELRTAVQVQPEPIAFRRRSRAYAAAAAAVAGIAAAIAVPLTSGGSPAFAVQDKSDGSVVVTIDRLEDAAGLQDALAAHGLPATVDYHGGLFDPRALPAGPGGDVSCGPGNAPTVTAHDGSVTVVIPAPTVAAVHAGQSLTIKIDTLDPEARESGSPATGRMLAAVGNDRTGCGADETGGWMHW